jgi:DNA-binding MarR family transcriptional regulator
MVKDSTSVLSNKNAVPIMIQLLEKETTNKSDLLKVSSMHTINNILSQLEKEGYVNIKEEFIGRRTYLISLTPKGRAVAEQLKRAEEVAQGDDTNEPARFQMPLDWKDRFKGLSAMTHLNVLDDHVAIEEIDSSGKITSVVMVYIRRINSHFELWCEKDESTECKHVDFAWSLPQMRALIEEYLKEGKIKDVRSVE